MSNLFQVLRVYLVDHVVCSGRLLRSLKGVLTIDELESVEANDGGNRSKVRRLLDELSYRPDRDTIGGFILALRSDKQFMVAAKVHEEYTKVTYVCVCVCVCVWIFPTLPFLLHLFFLFFRAVEI